MDQDQLFPPPDCHAGAEPEADRVPYGHHDGAGVLQHLDPNSTSSLALPIRHPQAFLARLQCRGFLQPGGDVLENR